MLKIEWASPAARAKKLALREAELGLLEIPNEQKPRRFALPMLAAVFAIVSGILSLSMAAEAERRPDRWPDSVDAADGLTTSGAVSPGVATSVAVPIGAGLMPGYDGGVCNRSETFVGIGGCRVSRTDFFTTGSALFFVLTIVFITLGRRIFGK